MTGQLSYDYSLHISYLNQITYIKDTVFNFP